MVWGMSEACDLPAVEARRLIGAKQLSPVELLESSLVDAVNPALNAIVGLDREAALSAAREAELMVMRGEPLSAIHGLPVGVKDLDATAGLTTTWGSLIYKGHVPSEDDPHIARIRAAGGVIVGKTNTPEFGAGSTRPT